jgi:hypothetical protein
MPEHSKPRCPSGIGRAGRRLWKSIVDDAATQNISLDSLELTYLADAAALSDSIEQFQAALYASETGLMVKGYQGQPVEHPLIKEIRQHRALRALTLARIKVNAPASEQQSGFVLPIGVQQRDAANKRWGK